MNEIKKIDFSQFHPLDHWMLTKRCREMYGGWRTHWKYGWAFKWKDDIRRHTLCLVGIHKAQQWTRVNTGKVSFSCRGCGKKMPDVPPHERREWLP